MSINIGAICDRGCLRANNEDHVLVVDAMFTDGKRFIALPDTQRIFVAVADGMGGHNAGEVASSMVLSSLQNILEILDQDLSFSEFEHAMGKWLKHVHIELLQAGDTDPSLWGMGTTLTGLYWGLKGKYVFNAGDSRTYWYYRGDLKQITRDHSPRSDLDSPAPRSNLLVNCVGAVGHSYLDVFDVSDKVVPGAIFLLCSDGLTDMIDDATIAKFLKPLHLIDLVEEAKKRGGNDNISVISLQWESQE